MKNLRVALVSDWIYGGGSEKVVEQLHKMFPDAPIYTSFCTEEWQKRLDGKVVTGFLNKWPFRKLYKFLAVLRIWWIERLDLTDYDLIISVSGNGEAFGVKRRRTNSVHINYCNTPTHYYWRHYDQFIRNPGFGIFNPLARLGLAVLVRPLRKWDYKAAQRADYIIANSTHIQRDIKKYYRRDSAVIFPPVDVSRFKHLASKKRTGFVTFGRFAPQKRLEIIVEACTKLGIPLIVAGRGPEQERLQKIAGPTVQFKISPSDKEIEQLATDSEAFLFASFEDFGIVPVEAMAAGTPVIAYKAGGALDYVVPNKTGTFFEHQTAESLVKALKHFDSSKFNANEIRKQSEQFSPEHFQNKIRTFIERCLHEQHS